MSCEVRDATAAVSADGAKTTERKQWVAPSVIVSAVTRVTSAKTSSGFGFETHSPGSLNGS